MIGRVASASQKTTVPLPVLENFPLDFQEFAKSRGKPIAIPHATPPVAPKTNSKIFLMDSSKSEPLKISTSQPRRRFGLENEDTELWCSKTNNKNKPPFQTLPLLKDRLGHLLDDKYHTDVVFLVGPKEEKLEAHRLILSSASPVFEQLLYVAKPLSLDDKMVLYEPEFSMLIFQVFIKGIYTNEVPLCLSLSYALEVFYIAKKYDVKFLQTITLEHVNQAVTTVNVFEALAISTRMIELTPMVPICWKIIEEETENVLEHHFETLDARMLGRILERDQLNLGEVELFQYLIRWAVNRCKQRGLKPSIKFQRQMMEPLLKHIRFTTMEATAIHKIIVPARILEPKEVTSILSHVHSLEHKSPVPFKTIPRRKPVKVKSKHVFTGCYSSHKLLKDNGGPHAQGSDSGASSARTQILSSSESEDNSEFLPCTIKSKKGLGKVEHQLISIKSPKPIRHVKKSPSKNSKHSLKNQRTPRTRNETN